MATKPGFPPPWGEQPDPGGSDRERLGPTLPDYMDPEGNHGGVRILRIQGVAGEDGHPLPLPSRPFIIRKSIQRFLCGKIDGAFPEGQGRSYALKVRSAQQYIKLQELKALSDATKVEVIPHPSLNTTRFVVSCRDMIKETEQNLVEDLKDQGVKEVRRITRREGNGRVNTATLIITCHGTCAPEYVDFGYLRCRTRPYYPSPMQCFNCWAFGHTKMRCKATRPICGKCSRDHPIPEDRSCSQDKFCARCNTDQHSLSDRVCPSYVRENAIQKLKVDRDLSYPDARRLYDQNNGVRSFSGVTSASLESKFNEMNDKIEDLVNQVRERDRTILQLQSALQMNAAPGASGLPTVPSTNPVAADLLIMFQQQMEQNNRQMQTMNENFQQSIRALMKTQVQTQQRLQNIEASIQASARSSTGPTESKSTTTPLLKEIGTTSPEPKASQVSTESAAITAELGEAPEPISKTNIVLANPNQATSGNDSIIEVSSDVSISSDVTSDTTITPDNSPNTATKLDTPLPPFSTPKSSKRPITELDPPLRPSRLAPQPKLLKPLRISPESPEKAKAPRVKWK